MNFKVVDFNPNESTGGAGCLCSEVATADTKGPFVVFYGDNEMDSAVSPVPVLCAGCASEAYRQLSAAPPTAGEAASALVGHPTGRPLDGKELPEL